MDKLLSGFSNNNISAPPRDKSTFLWIIDYCCGMYLNNALEVAIGKSFKRFTQLD